MIPAHKNAAEKGANNCAHVGSAQILKILKMLQKEYYTSLANIGVDTAESKPPKVTTNWGVPKQELHPSCQLRSWSNAKLHTDFDPVFKNSAVLLDFAEVRRRLYLAKSFPTSTSV